MSAIIVLSPLVVAAWPILVSSVVAAATAAGFQVVKNPKKAACRRSVDLEMQNAEVVADGLDRDDRIVVERQEVRVIFSRDARGRFRTCVEGDLSKEQLEALGRDLGGRVIQRYLYRRLTEELRQNGFTMLSEDQGPDETIRLRVRRYQG
jgi:hypothetical protein